MLLIAKKWDYSERRQQNLGRPRVNDEATQLVLQMARENPTWGYDRIQGALANLGHEISDQTVGNIRKEHGIEPAPQRKRQTSWSTFLKAHWDVLGSIDFTTIEIWTKGGLVTFYLLFVMELKTRRVHFAGFTTDPNETWMKQIARNLIDVEDGFLNDKRYLLMDRDSKFCEVFRDTIKSEGVDPVRLPPQSSNLNARLERFMKSIKDEALHRMIFFGEDSLRRAISSYLEHYHGSTPPVKINRQTDYGSRHAAEENCATCYCHSHVSSNAIAIDFVNPAQSKGIPMAPHSTFNSKNGPLLHRFRNGLS